MQPGIKNDLVHLLIMLQSIEKVNLFSEKFNSASDFYQYNDQIAFDACLLMLTNIGERSSRLSEEATEKYSEIPWKKIKQVRNRIAHDYTGVDFEIAFSIINNDLPPLKTTIIKIIRDELSNGIFSSEEFELAKKSEYYRHIKFAEIA